MKAKLTILTVIIQILFMAIAFAEGIEILSSSQVFNEINKKEVQIFDVNPIGIFEKGHIPSAKHIEFSKVVESLPKDKNLKLIFYCKNKMCTASHQAAQMAVNNGFKKVARMPEGIDGWMSKKLPIEKSGDLKLKKILFLSLEF